MRLLQKAREPDFIQGHAHTCALPQGADFFRFLSTVKRVSLQTEVDEVLKMLR
jgi:hypothetical protein